MSKHILCFAKFPNTFVHVHECPEMFYHALVFLFHYHLPEVF